MRINPLPMKDLTDRFNNLTIHDQRPLVSKWWLKKTTTTNTSSGEWSFDLCEALSLSLIRTVIQTTSLVYNKTCYIQRLLFKGIKECSMKKWNIYCMYLVHQKIWEFKTLVLSLWVKQLYKCEKQINKQTNKQTDQQTKNYQKHFNLKI